jgi:hypothetical protein
VVAGLSELQRTGGQVLVTSMCIGSGGSLRFQRLVRCPDLCLCLGMGAAGLFVNEKV